MIGRIKIKEIPLKYFWYTQLIFSPPKKREDTARKNLSTEKSLGLLQNGRGIFCRFLGSQGLKETINSNLKTQYTY